MPVVAGHKGIDVRETRNRLVFDAFLQNMSGALVTSGATRLYLYELCDNGSLNSYDFSSNTFKTTALTNEFASLTHRMGNSGVTNTGIWTSGLTTLTGFSQSGIYYARVWNTNAMPNDQTTKFQFGSAPGDMTLTPSYNLKSDLEEWRQAVPAALTPSGAVITDVYYLTGSGIKQSIGYIGIDWAQILNKTTTNDFTGTSVKTATDVETDTQNIQSRIPNALTASGYMKSDMMAINNDAAAAAMQALAARAIFSGTASAGSTTTLDCANLNQADVNHWNGRVIIFMNGTLQYQATAISAFDPTNDRLTFTAVTTAVGNGQDFIIV